MAKLNRERRLLERRIEKKAKKDARKRAAADDTGEAGTHSTDATELSAAVDAAAREQQRQ